MCSSHYIYIKILKYDIYTAVRIPQGHHPHLPGVVPSHTVRIQTKSCFLNAFNDGAPIILGILVTQELLMEIHSS